MVLYLIGLGLGDEKDITLKGLEAIQRCKYIFLEHYTAVLGADTEAGAAEGAGKASLEKLFGLDKQNKQIIIADRELVESQSEQIVERAKEKDENGEDVSVAFLVVGDPFAATTHHDLLLRAADEGIRVETIHNASIMNAVAQTGLQLYQFGQTVSICFFRDSWRPDSFYDKVADNMRTNSHTLCLLDIKVKEQSFDNMARGVRVYEKPRYMSVTTAIEQLLEVADKKRAEEEQRIQELQAKHGHEQQDQAGQCAQCATHATASLQRREPVYSRDTLAFGLARVGQASQQIVSGTLGELLDSPGVDFGAPLHSLVLAAPKLHEVEQAMFEYWHWDRVARGAQRKAARAEREAKDKQEEALRIQKQKEHDAANPPAPLRSTIPKQRAPVKASASASAAAAAADSSSDDEGEVNFEPIC